MSKTVRSIVLGLILSPIFLAPQAATANEIILVSPDKTVSVRGLFVGFQQDMYLVSYNQHVLEVPAAQMNCAGVGCIQFQRPSQIITADNDE